MHYLIDRLKEGSTWAAITALLVALGIKPELAHSIESFGIGAAALAAILLRDKAS